MAEELAYRAEAATEYDRAFSHVSAYFLPFLPRAARLAPGQFVIDVATGTGIAAEAALGIVGPAGGVMATECLGRDGGSGQAAARALAQCNGLH